MNDQHRALYNRAAALASAGKMAEAEPLLRMLVQEDAAAGEAMNLLAVIATSTHRPAMAEEFFGKALAVNPDNTEWLGNYAQFCMMRGAYARGTEIARRILNIDPNSAQALGALGGALTHAGEIDEAVRVLERAVELSPRSAAWLKNLGTAYLHLGRYKECEAALLKCLSIAPDDGACFTLSECLLLTGDFARGWAAYEGRWAAIGMSRPRHQQIPAWRGEDLRGRTILLWADQALGDTFQFLRFAKVLHERGAAVVLECFPMLKPFFARCDFLAAVRGEGEPLPRVDVQLSLGSCPRVMQVHGDTAIPAGAYLSAEARAVRRWSEKLKREGRKNVGLVWAGNPRHSRDKERSIAIETFMAITKVPGCSFYSLQVGPAGAAALPPNVTSLSASLKTWDETAAALANLDLLITVDTAICHLAGAMGVNVATLVTHVPDWRWQLNRSDSPWYPSMRLFRQPKRGDWESVIVNVSAALEQLAMGNRIA